MCASMSFQVGAFGIDFIAAVEVTAMNPTLLQWIWRFYLSTYNHRVFCPVKDKKKKKNVFINGLCLECSSCFNHKGSEPYHTVNLKAFSMACTIDDLR